MVLASHSKHAAASQRAHLELLQLGGGRGYSACCPVAETVAGVALTSRPSCSGTSRDARGCSYRVRARGGCKRLGGAIRLGQCAVRGCAGSAVPRRGALRAPSGAVGSLTVDGESPSTVREKYPEGALL